MTQYNGPRRPGAGSSRPQGATRPSSQPPVRRPAPQQQRPVRRPEEPGRQARPVVSGGGAPAVGRRLPRELWLMVVIGIIVCVLAFFAQLKWPNGFSVHQKKKSSSEEIKTVAEIHSSGPLRINELMSSNQTGLMDAEGKTRDWIEIINIGSGTVNLSGYTLAKSEKASNVFEFPNVELEAGGCVIVFADSTLAQEAGSEYHAPFRLSSKGGTLMLFGPSGTAIDSVNYPAIPTDQSYARRDRTAWEICERPTPGYANDDANAFASITDGTDSGVELSEIVASNTQYAPDENGSYQDYIELHNTTGEVKDLSGWFLSDDPERPRRWQLPDGFLLQPGEYRIVYASGLNKTDTNPPHAGFGLNTEGETVTLSDARGNVVDTTTYDLLKTDIAWCRDGSSWRQGTPTPAAANQ